MTANIELPIPETWENHTVKAFVGPAGNDGFAPSITVAPHEVATPVALEQLVKELPLSDAMEDLLVLDRGYKTEGNARYFERTYRFIEPARALLVTQRQRIVMIDRKPHIFTATGTSASFADVAGAFDAVFTEMLN